MPRAAAKRRPAKKGRAKRPSPTRAKRTKKYFASPGARFGDKKAQSYGEYLFVLKKGLGHPPSTNEIYADAKRSGRRSPFHHGLTWNDRAAAQALEATVGQLQDP